MSLISIRTRAVVLGAVCAAGGIGAGAVATAGAADSHSTTARHAAHAQTHANGRTPERRLRRLARRTVHASDVVHTRQGFVTRTLDRGTVDSVSGQTLTMTDGTRKAQYHQQTITIPSGAKVRDDRKTASLSDLTAGQRVLVVQMPQRTIVRALTPKHAAR